MTKREVIARLCELARLVNTEVFEYKIPSDCFCQDNGFNFQFDEKVLKFKTQAISLLPWVNTALPLYIDTSDIPVGEYTLEVDLRYEGDSTKYEFPISVVEGVLEELEDLQPPPSMNPWTIIGVSVGILIILNIILMIILRRRKNSF